MHAPSTLVMICLAASCASAAAPVAPVERPARLGLCVACHGEDGSGQQPGQPHLGGQDAAYLQDALQQYRDGRRSGSAMTAIAGVLSPADVEALARWYAAQPCRRGSVAAAASAGAGQ